MFKMCIKKFAGIIKFLKKKWKKQRYFQSNGSFTAAQSSGQRDL